MNKQRVVIFLFGAVILMSACGDTVETTEVPSPGDDVQYGLAPVEAVEVVFLESFPLQVQLKVQGYMPDGCTEIDSTDVEQVENHFEVTIKTVRPTNVACTQAIEPYEQNVPLDVYGLSAGEYTVDVNAVKASFTLEQDNILESE
jgi:inhibitor of cysteine peptidase